MKFGVVVFPGSNCDEDMVYVLDTILKQKVIKLWHKDTDLQGCDFIVLPGGFSYGDYLRCGAIARFSPIMDAVIAHANKGGYVLGICNGFQVLTETHLLPGALLLNDTQRFICQNQWLRCESTDSKITSYMDKGGYYNIPIAHADGRYFAKEDTLKALTENDQILFRYCDEKGFINEQSNPNGSVDNIAGVCNEGRNIFGMMPHPERAADPVLGNTDGLKLFESILELAVQQ